MYDKGTEVQYSVILEYVYLQNTTGNIEKFLQDKLGGTGN